MDLISGLPIHPLINHAVAVLVPLSAIGAILLIFVPKFRNAYSTLLLFFLGAAAISGLIAENSGEALSKRVGSPGSHAQNGELLSKLILLFALVYLAWYLIERKISIFKSANSLLRNGVSAVLLLVAILSTGMTFVVGHSGASATWEKRIAASNGNAITDSLSQGSTAVAPKASAGEVILSAAEIEKHNSKSDCWSLIRGKVYNLSGYVQNHPGGQSVIAAICGKDGTSAFSNQHGTSGKPNNVLNGLLIGNLGAVVAQDALAAAESAAKSSGGSYSGDKEEEEEEEDKDRD